MKIALCQMDIAWMDKRRNLDQVKRRILEAEALGAAIIAFPEMALTGFVMDPGAATVEADGPELSELLAATRGLGITALLGVAVRQGGRARNQCWVIRDGARIGAYTKIHPFSKSREETHYERGEELLVFEVAGRRFAPLICYDLRFPEAFAALADRVDGGIFVLANWPESRREHWKILLAARALDAQTHIFGVNRVGSGGGLSYSGDSMAHLPTGEPLLAPSATEELRVARIDPEAASEFRAQITVLRDRRRFGTGP